MTLLPDFHYRESKEDWLKRNKVKGNEYPSLQEDRDMEKYYDKKYGDKNEDDISQNE
jgi:hypothetical protein